MTITKISIQSFMAVAPNLPANIAVLMRGPTGIGKSHLAKQIADHHNLPFIDVRGAAMSEGDVGGYPDIEGMKESGMNRRINRHKWDLPKLEAKLGDDELHHKQVFNGMKDLLKN